MNNIIVTINSYPSFEFNKQSIESFRYAANRWNCDFFERINRYDPKYPTKSYIWDKFWVLSNFQNYDSVLYLDSDCIINSISENIFDQVDDEHDVFVVLDGNPGRFKNDFYKKTYSKNFSIKANENIIFHNMFENFNEKNYYDNYFNCGMFLFKPKNMKDYMDSFFQKIMDEKIMKYFAEGNDEQNFMNAWFLEQKIKTKFLDNTWNWIAPDIVDEFEMYSGRMVPNIYHFCGTNLSKERLKNYDRWR